MAQKSSAHLGEHEEINLQITADHGEQHEQHERHVVKSNNVKKTETKKTKREEEKLDTISPNASGLQRFGHALLRSFKGLGTVFAK